MNRNLAKFIHTTDQNRKAIHTELVESNHSDQIMMHAVEAKLRELTADEDAITCIVANLACIGLVALFEGDESP